MANYPKELEDLIQEYLTDGIITAKERQVLLNKAASLGLNVDEIDLYIDAQQQKADQQVDAAVRKQRGQTCPFCSGSVPQLADKCPHCGQHLTVEASAELTEIIDKLEDALVDFKSGKDFAKSKAIAQKYIRRANLYYSNNPKLKILLDEVNTEIATIEETAKNNAKKEARKRYLQEHSSFVGGCGVVLCAILVFLICLICGARGDESLVITFFVFPLYIGAFFLFRAIFKKDE